MNNSFVEDNIVSKCEKIKSTLVEKNKMYGNSFFNTLEEYGNCLICVRLEDKLNRLKQIIVKGLSDTESDEKLIDTLTDIAGYSILSLVYLENIQH